MKRQNEVLICIQLLVQNKNDQLKLNQEGDNDEIKSCENVSLIDLEDILEEDEEIREQVNHLNSDFLTISIMNHLFEIRRNSIYQSKTIGISTNYLIKNYWEKQLALFSNKKNNKTIQIQAVSYISVKGQIIAVGFENGLIQLYEGSQLKVKQYQLEDVEQIFGLYYGIKGTLLIYKRESRNFILSFKNQDRIAQLFDNLIRAIKISIQQTDLNQELYIQHINYLIHQCIKHIDANLKNPKFLQFCQLFMHLFRYSPTEQSKQLNQIMKHLIKYISRVLLFLKNLDMKNNQQQIIRNENIKILKLLYTMFNKSNLYETTCIKCQLPDTQDQAILLKCGHTNHPFCLENKYCPICQNISTQSCIYQNLRQHYLKALELKNQRNLS